ncbi:hypothetical protein bcere0020_55050 [Bacillus cereus Rock3-29]|nr:hypothetical protein bcere0020_55050 [Bacillus cereus Rock3-29]
MLFLKEEHTKKAGEKKIHWRKIYQSVDTSKGYLHRTLKSFSTT